MLGAQAIFLPGDNNMVGFIQDGDVEYAGQHLLIDLYNCQRHGTQEEIKQVMIDSCLATGATVLYSYLHPFTGGGIRFNAWDIEVYPKPGSALFYPSNYIGAHEVLEVTSGIRWAFLAFLSHGDRTYLNTSSQAQYLQRYEWTMKLRKDIYSNHTNLNSLQKKVPIYNE